MVQRCESPVPEKLSIIGYDNPIGTYPAPVVLKGRLPNGTIVIIHTTLDGQKTIEPIISDTQVEHELRIPNFRWRTLNIFAFAPDEIQIYTDQEREQFFSDLLSDQDFSARNPHIRYALAKVIGDQTQIAREMERCREFRARTDPQGAERWYEAEKKDQGR